MSSTRRAVGPKLTASNNGTNKLAAAGVAHSRTGISTSNAATRSGACTATCSETFAPRDTPPTINADWDVVPDLHDLTVALREEFDVLHRLTGPVTAA